MSANFQELVTPEGRFSYLHLAEMSKYMDNKPSYSATILLEKNNPQVQEFISRLVNQVFPECASAKWGGSVNPATYTTCIKDGDAQVCGQGLNTKGEAKPGYAGHWFITFKDIKRQPYLCDVNRNLITTQDAMGNVVPDMSQVKSGDYGRLSVVVGATEYAGRKFISGYLRGVMKTREGEPLGGGGSPASPVSDFGMTPENLQQPMAQQPMAQQPMAQQPMAQTPPPPAAMWGADPENLPF